MKILNEIKILDPDKVKYAHLVKFVDEDIIKNKLPNMQLRCTHLSYIVGNLNDNNEFVDIMNDNEKYLYFKSVTDAVSYFGSETVQTPFVLKAEPISRLGIRERLTKFDIKEKLSTNGMYFNFKDDEKSNIKKLSY